MLPEGVLRLRVEGGGMDPLKDEFRCLICGGPADRITYYSKTYRDTNLQTIEDPMLCCRVCYDSPKAREKLFKQRGGIEAIGYLSFDAIARMSKKRIGYYISNRYWESYEEANGFWRKSL